jgi:hypothetical protein
MSFGKISLRTLRKRELRNGHGNIADDSAAPQGDVKRPAPHSGPLKTKEFEIAYLVVFIRILIRKDELAAGPRPVRSTPIVSYLKNNPKPKLFRMSPVVAGIGNYDSSGINRSAGCYSR